MVWLGGVSNMNRDNLGLELEPASPPMGSTPAIDPGAFPSVRRQSTAGDWETSRQGYLNLDQRGGGVQANGKTSYTIDRAAQQITGSASGQTQTGWGTTGQPFTVTYAFRSTEPSNYPDGVGGFARLDASQIVSVGLALQSWSDVANINFVRVGSGTTGELAYSNDATILFSNYSSGEGAAAAFASMPGDTAASSESGDVWVNRSLSENQNTDIGSEGRSTLVHEIGHAIGLDHPGNYDATEGTDFTYANNAGYYEDTVQFTVMSYFSATNTGANFGSLNPAAPQLDDIAAIQVQYGANYATRSGDTVYGFNSTAGREWYSVTSGASRVVFAVWDGGGRDTLDFSGYAQDGTIDLREGYFSSVGGLVGNVAIARGAVIENAIGGSGNDALTGNVSANALYGGAGGDTLNGGAGLDYLRGEDGNDLIYGGDAFDDTHGNMGDDTVYGGQGDDWVVGGKDNDQLFGDSGIDIVWGNLGNDTCRGGDDRDQVRGGQGNDVVYGEGGSDYVSGDRGNDTVYGGAGADWFHGSQDQGIDQIMDFSLAEGDRMLLDPGTTYAVSQVGADTVLDMGNGNQMILVGVQLSSLGATSGWIIESYAWG